MKFGVRGWWWVPAAAAVLLWGAAEPNADLLQQHRNLGKAFYENPTTQAEAVTEFKQALDLAPDSIPDRLNYALALLRAGNAAQAVPILEEIERRDPSLPHPWFNLGIYFKQNNELVKATAQFERMIQLVPNEAIGHYQLGALYRAADRPKDAEAQFQRAAELNPLLAAPHFQLFNLYRTGGRAAGRRARTGRFPKAETAGRRLGHSGGRGLVHLCGSLRSAAEIGAGSRAARGSIRRQGPRYARGCEDGRHGRHRQHRNRRGRSAGVVGKACGSTGMGRNSCRIPGWRKSRARSSLPPAISTTTA